MSIEWLIQMNSINIVLPIMDILVNDNTIAL